jgi:hypothetical protein
MLSALIANSPDGLRNAAGSIAPVIELPQGFAIVPLTESVREAVLGADEPMADDVSYLTPALRDLAKAWSADAAVAYVESETHGGTGTQVAVIWRNSEVIWGPRYTANNTADVDDVFTLANDASDYAINAALRELGVDATGHIDEYAALGLDMKRNTEDWLL